MKKFIRTLKSLSERAAQFQETLQQVPPKVAEIRQAVSLTSGQLRQLQADVQVNVASLKADNPDRLVEALHEINGSNEVFQEAGYALGHVEMELSPVPRLIVHLDRVEDVRDSILSSLADANRQRRITHALLNAVIQAEAVTDRVDIQGQVYYRLTVHVGPVPSVRLGWMPEPRTAPSAPPSGPAPLTSEAATASHFTGYGKGSFFAGPALQAGPPTADNATPTPKPAPAGKAAAAEIPMSKPQHVPSPLPETTARSPVEKEWGRSALERFKQMPGASKYRR